VNAVAIRLRIQRFTWFLAIAACSAGPAFGAPTNQRIIVTLDDSYHPENAQLFVNQFNNALDTELQLVRTMSGRSVVLSHEQPAETGKLINQLRALTGVVDVAHDAAVTATTVDDPRFEKQWQLHSPERYLASLNLPQAWNITHGSAEVVVAVVDTGVDYNHPDLNGRLLPGYDFVSSVSKSVDRGIVVPDDLAYLRSHDGDGRDTDASDPGDAISETTRQQFDSLDIDCYVGNSSWHGTAMASIISIGTQKYFPCGRSVNAVGIAQTCSMPYAGPPE